MLVGCWLVLTSCPIHVFRQPPTGPWVCEIPAAGGLPRENQTSRRDVWSAVPITLLSDGASISVDTGAVNVSGAGGGGGTATSALFWDHFPRVSRRRHTRGARCSFSARVRHMPTGAFHSVPFFWGLLFLFLGMPDFEGLQAFMR